ncbi:MAG: aminotransferase class IV [Phycisphaerales bacterium]
MATVFLNGEFLGKDQARVSAFDAGFQHGVGLFETMLAVREGGGRILHLQEHLARIADSARTLGLTEVLRVGPLGEACERTLERAMAESEAARIRIRLTITGGDLNLLDRQSGGQPMQPTLLIVAQPATEYPPEMFENGVLAVVADFKANPLDAMQGHKTLNYWGRLRELQRAGARRAAEAIVLQVSNHVCGGCVSNIFIAKGGVLRTPIARGEEQEVADDAGEELGASQGRAIVPSPVLPGVVRRWVMDWCTAMDVEVQRRMLTIHDVLEADEVFLTNSSWGVLPVTRVEGRTIGGGTPGRLAGELRGAWGELLE